MKQISLYFFLLSFVYTSVYGQAPDSIKYFKYGGFTSFTFNQLSLNNWSAGGENALSSTAILNLFYNFKKQKMAWDNSVDLAYGLLRNGSSKMRKNEDKIEINSKFGYEAIHKVYYSALINFRSQFSEGFNYSNKIAEIKVSQFMAPAFLSIGMGLDYKPTSYFSVYLSPATGRFTFVLNQELADSGAYGVDKAIVNSGIIIQHGNNVHSEFGASLSTSIQKDIFKSINLSSKLVLFNNYTDKDKVNRKNLDVNWEVMINIKAGKFITTSITTNLIYDHNIISRTQFKESIGLGLSYKF